jgi:hypothetical protein
MVFKKKFLLLFLFFFVPTVFCFEIPIDETVEKTVQNNITFVDMDKVFNLTP